MARRLRPGLVVLDLLLPGLDGVEICHLLRKDPRTASVGIIMVTARTSPMDRVVGLEAGADDYVDKPFDVRELVARVNTSLRRARRLRATSPLTGLPGNFEIETRLDARIAGDETFALLHIDLDGFKSFNDRYGFLRGDQAILHTAHIVVEAAEEIGGPDAFVGHIGGDDFVLVCGADHAEVVASAITERFDRRVAELYDDADREVGYIELVDRTGATHRHPLLSVSIGVASSEVGNFSSSIEAAAIAVELKGFAKAAPGSAWRIDRRKA
jgi:diguanylate cyclase (GGDEF)-like protein